jgi:DNA polymerase I-like protein with 3'-5' exonuclease and polymerase domains
MRPSTFQEDVLKESDGEVDLTKTEAEDFHATYHNLFSEISNGWWPMLEYQVRKTGYLFNLFGYPLYAQGPYTEKTWRELTALVPQSTVGCITAIAFCIMQMFIEQNGLEDRWHLRNDKHDSLLVECPEEDKHECCMVAKASIEQWLRSPTGEDFQMKSEVGWGYNWGKQTEKNPNGMREYEA